MPIWSKLFHRFRANLRTAATERMLRRPGDAPAVQARTFATLLPSLARSSVWRAYGVTPKTTPAEFQARVPLQTPERLAPAIERMVQGEPDVLWPGTCTFFATTAGTSTGTPRLVPVTEAMLTHVQEAATEALLYYTARVRHAGVFAGRHVWLTGSSTVVPLDAGQTRFRGDLAAISRLTLPQWFEQHVFTPAAPAAGADGEDPLAGVVQGTRGVDVALLTSLPNWISRLAQTAQAGDASAGSTLPQRWPNLECLVHTGAPLAPYHAQARAALGRQVAFHEVYAATEAIIAAQANEPGQGLRLITDAGVYFEFLPMASFDEAKLEQLGAQTVPLAGVQSGIDYALVITTPGGLARYVLGDVVRFTSSQPPRLTYVGRTDLRLDAFSERVHERDLDEALTEICTRLGWSMTDYHVAPLHDGLTHTGQRRGRHEWWIELRPGTTNTPTGPFLAAEIDAHLRRACGSYAGRRDSGHLGAPEVKLVMPGVFEHWLRFQGRWGARHKVPRCRSDRTVADQLDQITQFARG